MQTDLLTYRAQRAQMRGGMLVSLLVFTAALYMLAAQLPGGVAAAVFACLFWLVGIRLLRRRCLRTSRRLHALYGPGRSLDGVSYIDHKPCDGELLIRLGVAPRAPFLEGSICRHVLGGMLSGFAATVAEVAFTPHPQGGVPAASLTGTLIHVEARGTGHFLALRREQLPGLLKQGSRDGFSNAALPDGCGLPEGAALLSSETRPLAPRLVEKISHLLSACTGPVCVASSPEGIAVFLPRRFYALAEDRELAASDFSPMPELELIAGIAEAYHCGQNSSCDAKEG
ncbi:MAG: hypothetical protein VB099_20120 [Candidatus Limiplasma sp.]|nr:hypothetical protein [Candidatus Limiplasma sp.]